VADAVMHAAQRQPPTSLLRQLPARITHLFAIEGIKRRISAKKGSNTKHVEYIINFTLKVSKMKKIDTNYEQTNCCYCFSHKMSNYLSKVVFFL
jgi:hypothetical protein